MKGFHINFIFIISLFENFILYCFICELINSHNVFVAVESTQLTFSNLLSPTLFEKKKCDSNCVLNRVATQGSKEQPKDVLIKIKEALVCFDTQFFGLLQEFREKCFEIGYTGPEQPLLSSPT